MSDAFHCPICGASEKLRHRCDPRKLAAIDRAHRGAELEPGQTDPVRQKPYGARLADGTLMRTLTDRDD